MCMMLYISSSKQLPEIPWNQYESYFKLKNLDKPENSFWERARTGVSSKTSGRYLYSVIAHTGCGCGFAYGVNPIYDDEDQEEEDKNRKSIELLFLFLRQHFQPGEVMELYSCVAEREGNTDYIRTSINAADFDLGDTFELNDGELLTVSV